MPRMSATAVASAANATSLNQVAGLQYEFLQRPTRLILAAVGSAIGLNVTLIVGSITVIDDQPISGANRFPVLPDDQVTGLRNAVGRIILRFRNTTGGALTFNWSLDVG